MLLSPVHRVSIGGPDADAEPHEAGVAVREDAVPAVVVGLGMPVLEAFAAQVPVITSNTTSLPEVTGDAAVSLDPMDVDAIARAMKRLSEDSAFAEGLKQRGVARARQFTWQKCADATLDVYRRVLAK